MHRLPVVFAEYQTKVEGGIVFGEDVTVPPDPPQLEQILKWYCIET